MTVPDFELTGRLRAKSLRGDVPPQPSTEAVEVELERRERRSRLPKEIAAAVTYTDIRVDKRLSGYAQRAKNSARGTLENQPGGNVTSNPRRR